MDNIKHAPQGKTTPKSRPIVSATLEDGTIIETVYRPDEKQTAFVVWKDNTWRLEEYFVPVGGKRLTPYSAENNLIKNDVVLLTSTPEEYESEEALVSEIQRFIRRYVDVTPMFEKIASYYVLFSWVYDGFNELPYLRLRGDFGSGKTRFLLTVGSLCYKPIFASGASSISPIFHMLDAFRGTLIIDEGDFRFSDEKAEMVKILNNGNSKGFPVLRCEVNKQGEFNPRAFNVFGPKIVATRGIYQDRALESRFITEEMGTRPLREDIPISLPSNYKEEALKLRNKLLFFRFRKFGKQVTEEGSLDRTIEPRLNQIFAPLMSVIEDKAVLDELRDVIRHYNSELIIDRGMDIEAQILEVIRDLFSDDTPQNLSVKNITQQFIEHFGEDFERRISAKWIGTIVRKRLHLKTQKSHGVFVIPISEERKLKRLFEKYGIEERQQPDESTEDATISASPTNAGETSGTLGT